MFSWCDPCLSDGKWHWFSHGKSNPYSYRCRSKVALYTAPSVPAFICFDGRVNSGYICATMVKHKVREIQSINKIIIRFEIVWIFEDILTLGLSYMYSVSGLSCPSPLVYLIRTLGLRIVVVQKEKITGEMMEFFWWIFFCNFWTCLLRYSSWSSRVINE